MGAYYNATDREFRNYSYVKSTNAVNNSTTETWFHQGNGTSASADSGGDSPGYTAGLPYRTIVKDGTGVVRSQEDTLYAVDADGVAPYFTPVEQVDNWFCDAPGTCKQTRSILTFDHTNGNLTREDQYGDLSVTTDDRTATKSYSPNTTAWVLGLPASEIVYQGIGTTTQVARTDFYYDQVTDCNIASTNQTPTKGEVTRTVRWLSGGTSPETRMAYDTYGNLICAKDPNGNTTTFTYDTSSTFQKVITNALGHQTTTQYYGVDGVATDTGLYGQVKSITTPNGEVTTTTYDVFGRKTFMHDPDMGNWIYEYDNVGNLMRQTDARGGAINFTYDALNRVKTKTATTSAPPTAPSNLTASLSGTQVNLTWTTSSSSVGVDRYEVWRSLNNGAYTLIANPTGANFSDTTVSSGSTYLYRVRAVDVAMNASSYSNADYVTLFTDHPLVAGTTLVKAQHLTELRQAVNAARAAAGLAAAVWTDAPLSGIFIKAVHIQELRDNLAPALSALGLAVPTYTDPTLTAGSTFVKKVHIEELRQAVQ